MTNNYFTYELLNKRAKLIFRNRECFLENCDEWTLWKKFYKKSVPRQLIYKTDSKEEMELKLAIIGYEIDKIIHSKVLGAFNTYLYKIKSL